MIDRKRSIKLTAPSGTENNTPIPFGALWDPTGPAEKTARELAAQKDYTPQDLGWSVFPRLARGLKHETVTGQLMKDRGFVDPVSVTNFQVDKDMLEEFAGDLRPDIQERIVSASQSYPEFLNEVHDARITQKARAELFSGGPVGMGLGFAATMLSAGGEAVMLTLLGQGLIGAGGAATAGARAAVTANHRIRAALKSASIAAGVDVPLEITRYQLDKTLRPADAIIAIGASGVLSGAIGAWKPHLFLKELQEMSHTSTLKEAADTARAAGKSDVADSIEATIKQKVKVRPVVEVHGEIAALKRPALMVRAKELEIEIMRVNEAGKKVQKKNAQLKQEIFEKTREAEGADAASIARQVDRDLEGTNATQRADYARNLGVPESVIKNRGKKLREATYKKAQEAADTGQVRTGVIPKLPKGLSLKKLASFKGLKIKFKSNVEAALWVIGKGGAKNAEKIKELKSWLKGSGIDDVDALAKQFVKDAKDMAGKGKSVEDISKLSRKELFRRAEEAGLDVRRDVTAAGGTRKLLKSADVVRKELAAHLKAKGTPADIDVRGMGVGGTKVRGGEVLEEGQGLFETRTSKGFEVDDPHPVSGTPDAQIIINGKVVGEGPADMVRLREEDLANVEHEQFKVFKKGQGIRKTIANAIHVFPGPYIKPLYSLFTPISIRLAASESPVIRKFSAIFLESSLGKSGNNVTTAVDVNSRRMTSRLYQKLDQAFKAARDAKLDIREIDIIRGVRSGQDFDGPLGDAVNAVRQFNSELLKYGKEGGIFVEAIGNPRTYFHRSYSHTAFTKAISEFGEDEVLEFFTNAILSQADTAASKLTKGKAKSIAERIMKFAKNPEAARDWRGTQIQVTNMKSKLMSEGMDEESVDGFISAITPNIENQPHISYGRRRIQLDETYEGVLGGERVHIDEFFNSDLRGNVTRYSQRVVGAVETRKGFKAMGWDPDTSQSEMLEKLVNAAADVGEDTAFVRRISEHAYKGLNGLPIYNNPHLMKWVMGSNSLAQATIGMTLGFAQLPEIASVMMRSGFRASFQQFPTLHEVSNIFTMGVRDLATGRKGLGMVNLKDDLASCLETFTGIGGDYRRGEHFMRRLDDMALDDDYVKFGMNKYMDYGRQTAVLNPLGIMPMDTFLRRWAVRSSFQHFVNEAYTMKSGKAALNSSFWNNAAVRFEQIGITGESFDRIAKALRDPNIVTTQRGLFGDYTVKNIDVDKMADVAAFDELALALKKHTDNMVQRQSYGEAPEWVNTQLGKLLSQYRVFMLASKSKQMAQGVARGDMREAVNVVGSAGLGVIAYQLQTYYRSAGMEPGERERYLAERFTEDNMINAGILKGSYSNIFPMLIDSAAWLYGGEPIFDPSMRTTGLGIDPLRGSVPYSILYGKMWPAVRETTGELFRGDKLSESDMRNVQSLIWATKIPGVDQLINSQFINKLGLQEKD